MSSVAPSDLPDAFHGHDHGRWAPVTCEVVASWARGHFVENVAVDSCTRTIGSIALIRARAGSKS